MPIRSQDRQVSENELETVKKDRSRKTREQQPDAGRSPPDNHLQPEGHPYGSICLIHGPS